MLQYSDACPEPRTGHFQKAIVFIAAAAKQYAKG